MTAGFQLVSSQDLSETQNRQAMGFGSCFSAHHWSHLAKCIELLNSVGQSGQLNYGKKLLGSSVNLLLCRTSSCPKQERLFAAAGLRW